jgi:hypothetical protein
MWDAPDTIDHGGKTYHRMLDLHDPSMFPPEVVAAAQMYDYADYYAFVEDWGSYGLTHLAPISYGVWDHQPRFIFSPDWTDRRSTAWNPDPTTHSYVGSPGQFMVPFGVEDVLVVYPFHAIPGVPWEQGMDAFTWDESGTTVVEFERPYAEEIIGNSSLWYGNGVGAAHKFTTGQNNLVGNDAKGHRPPAVWNKGYEVGPFYERNGVEMSIDTEWFIDATYYDAFVKAPLTLEPDCNFVVLQWDVYLPHEMWDTLLYAVNDPNDTQTDTDSFIRPFLYSYAPTGASPPVPGTVTTGQGRSGAVRSRPTKGGTA